MANVCAANVGFYFFGNILTIKIILFNEMKKII